MNACPSCGVESSDVRIIRRFAPKRTLSTANPSHTGLLVDVETTGLDSATDAIIQFACVPFTFTRDGQICELGKPIVIFNDPGRPIPPEITTLTGITDDMVRGHLLRELPFAKDAPEVDLVVAHNAAFDRPFVERALPGFAALPWGCAMADVPWNDEGYHGYRLEWLAYEHAGWFYDAHRADLDCLVALHLLTIPLPSGRNPFALVLEAARRKWVRIYAFNAPFSTKETLKARGYKWNPALKVWWTDVDFEDEPAEYVWLADHIPSVEPGAAPFGARKRFSERVR